jgi:hypothetical protein
MTRTQRVAGVQLLNTDKRCGQSHKFCGQPYSDSKSAVRLSSRTGWHVWNETVQYAGDVKAPVRRVRVPLGRNYNRSVRLYA